MSSVNEEMTALAEAIRAKANASGKMSIRKMTVTVRGISVGEGDATVQTEKQVLLSSPTGVIAPDSGFGSMSSVAYDLDVNSKANLKAENIKPGVKILGVTGNYTPPMESALVDSIEPTLIYPSEGKVGFDVVDVAIPRETVNATPTKAAQSFEPRNEGGAIVKVNVAPIPDNYIDPYGTKEILANGTDIDVRSYNAVTVRVPENTGEVCQHQEVLTITSPDNKTYYPGQSSPGHYYDAISKVEVEIPRDTKAVTPTKDEQIVTPESGTILSQVIVNPIPSVYVVPSGRLEITQPNTTRNCEKYAEVSVNVPIKENKIITANGVYDAADEGYEGFASVEVDVEPEDLSAELTTQANLISQIKTALAGKAAGGNSIIVGEWLLNNTLSAPPEVNFAVGFKDGDGNGYGRIITIIGDNTWSMYFDGNMAASDGFIEDPPYATLDFGDTPQTVPSDFGAWLMTNATYKAESGGGSSSGLSESELIDFIEGDIAGEFVIPDGTTSIRQSAFSACKKLTDITIPASVTSIGVTWLNGCSSMKTITCLAETPPSAANAMTGFPCTAIYVPAASVDAYKAASGWSVRESIITAIS